MYGLKRKFLGKLEDILDYRNIKLWFIKKLDIMILMLRRKLLLLNILVKKGFKLIIEVIILEVRKWVNKFKESKIKDKMNIRLEISEIERRENELKFNFFKLLVKLINF